MDTGYNEFLKGRLKEFQSTLDNVVLGLLNGDDDKKLWRHAGMRDMCIELSSKLDLLLAEFSKGSTPLVGEIIND